MSGDLREQNVMEADTLHEVASCQKLIPMSVCRSIQFGRVLCQNWSLTADFADFILSLG